MVTKKVKIPQKIPPRSVVRLVKADSRTPEWSNSIGKLYRIGYYNPVHPHDIALIDDNGSNYDTVDRKYLLKYFKIERLSNETDYFGRNRRRMGPLKTNAVRQDLRTRIANERQNVRLNSRWPGKIVDRFKWPIKRHVQEFRPLLVKMKSSRRKQPSLNYFIWPEKMRRVSFKGPLNKLMQFIEDELQIHCRSLRKETRKGIEDWQMLIIKSQQRPDIYWLATHRIYFVRGDTCDIWPDHAIQRVGVDNYLVWRA